MDISPYFLRSPSRTLSEEMQHTCSSLWDSIRPGDVISSIPGIPKWQLLTFLCETRDLVLHGTWREDLEAVTPRKARDTREFSAQEAIYTTTDGIWSLFFAVLDRKQYPDMGLFNSCVQIRGTEESWSNPFYFFSISQAARMRCPYRNGMVYLLPRASFTQEPPQLYYGMEISFPHWISTEQVMPAARMPAAPEDFPFLDQVLGHHDDLLARLSGENPEGFPWPEALVK